MKRSWVPDQTVACLGQRSARQRAVVPKHATKSGTEPTDSFLIDGESRRGRHRETYRLENLFAQESESIR
jgi:hypothetical protein